MPHLVNRRGYYSLESSYRDEKGRPRKKVEAYYGKRRPMRFSDIDWGASLAGEPGDGAASKAEWDANDALVTAHANAHAPAELSQAEQASDAPSESEPDADASSDGETSGEDGV